MREVAKKAGVSLATVSRVLNNTQYIAEETRQRVLEAVREFKYFKNVHARRLATGRSDLFGLVISEIANPYFPEIIRENLRVRWAQGPLVDFLLRLRFNLNFRAFGRVLFRMLAIVLGRKPGVTKQ